MLLDRRLGDPQRVRDAGIRASFRHQREHLPLPRREYVEWVVSTASGHELLHERRVHDRRAFDDPLERLDELVHIGHATLEQVAAPLATGEQRGRPLHLDVGGQRDDGGVGKLLAYRLGSFETLARVRGRHADVDDHEVGPELTDQREQLRGVPGLTHHVETGTLEQAGEALTQENLVVRHHDSGRACAHSHDYGVP